MTKTRKSPPRYEALLVANDYGHTRYEVRNVKTGETVKVFHSTEDRQAKGFTDRLNTMAEDRGWQFDAGEEEVS